MRFKPKEVLVNLPAVHVFSFVGDDDRLAASFNTLVHGKVKLKYESLGMLGGQYVSIFYLQRNSEFSELREEFMEMILKEEEQNRQDTFKPARRCRQVPECDCGNCRDPYGGHKP